MNLEIIKKLDGLFQYIITARRTSNLSDEEFSLSGNIQNKVDEIMKIYKENHIITTYENLTNMNNHILVKILNYNGFFNRNLKKTFREDLKKISIL